MTGASGIEKGFSPASVCKSGKICQINMSKYSDVFSTVEIGEITHGPIS